MTAPSRPAKRRMSLTLDTAMPFDALILTRLLSLPTARRQEWLRGLLIQGFQAECRLLRELDGECGALQPAVPDCEVTTPPGPRDNDLTDTRHGTRPRERGARVEERRPAGGEVSLAMLRKVIG